MKCLNLILRGFYLYKRNAVTAEMLYQFELSKIKFIWILLNFKYAASSTFFKTLDLSEIKLICTGLILLKVFFP